MAKKKTGLGRGLGALLESSETTFSINETKETTREVVGSVAGIPMDSIETNPFQPRTEFEKQALVDLANSIKEHGIIQPITVRKLGRGKYQIISGERRFRASQIIGLEEIPAYIRIANDQVVLEMAIVENIQRQDLNPMEISISFQRLIEECNLTQEELSEKVGKNRTTVANYLRLMKLPEVIQLGLKNKVLSMGHARALLGVENPKSLLKLYRKVIDEKLSVRKIEELVKGKHKVENTGNKPSKFSLSFEEQKIKEDLSYSLDSKVAISKTSKGNGKISIPFKNNDHLRKILDLLND